MDVFIIKIVLHISAISVYIDNPVVVTMTNRRVIMFTPFHPDWQTITAQLYNVFTD